jgi:hypothetical protein
MRKATKHLAGLRRDFNQNFLRRWFGSFFGLSTKRRDDSGAD